MGGSAIRANRVLVFVKAPRPGAVKTRLARSIGAPAAAAVYRRLAERILERLGGDSEAWAQTVCFSPSGARDEVEAWLGTRRRLVPQGEGDLGRRMQRAFARAFGGGAGAAVLVGTDVPGLSAHVVRQAFDALREHDVALGPASDGGYYMIGLRRPLPGLFEGVEWSTSRVLEQTLERARRLDHSVWQAATLRDVDTLADLRAEWGTVRPVMEGCSLLPDVERALRESG